MDALVPIDIPMTRMMMPSMTILLERLLFDDDTSAGITGRFKSGWLIVTGVSVIASCG